MSRRLWALFALFVLYGTAIPFNFNREPDRIRRRVEALSWNPLKRADGRRVSIPDTVQNVMLFVPFGVLGGLACRRRIPGGLARTAFVTSTGVALSVLSETMQLFTVDRVAAVSDVVTNGAGALAGAAATDRVTRWSAAFMGAYGSSRWMTNWWTYPAVSAIVVLLVFAWQPFDFALNVRGVGSKILALYRDPWQQGPVTDEGSAVVLYALATLAILEWLRASGVSRSWLKATIGMGLLVVGLELSQAIVRSRTPAGSDAVIRLIGVGLGGGLAPAVRGSFRRLPWLALLFTACVISAAISTWSPFQIRDQRDVFIWFFLLGSYSNNWFPAVSHAIELTLIYLPLGFVLATLHPRRSVVMLAGLFAFAAAVGTEYMQSWFVGRYADVTDVAFFTVGGVLGAWFGGRGAEMFESARAAAAPVPARISRVQQTAP